MLVVLGRVIAEISLWFEKRLRAGNVVSAIVLHHAGILLNVDFAVVTLVLGVIHKL